MSTIFPPIDADEKRRFRPIPIRVIIPNLITLIAVAAGMTAMRLAMEGRFKSACVLILIAGVLDMVDGRVARMIKGTSKFGEQLDSLADFVNFGVAPAFIVYFYVLNQWKSVGWIIAIIYAVSVAIRLARFNVAIEDDTKPDWMGDFFSGMPSPAGGICVLLPLYLGFIGLVPTFLHPPFVAVYMLAIALLMVSNLPVFSGKKSGMKVPSDWTVVVLIAGVALVALFAFHTWLVMSALVLIYIAAIPFGMKYVRKLSKNVETPPE